MKKRLLAAAVAATITLTAGVVMASPVQFNGDVDLHYRWNDDDASGKTEGGRATFKLNATQALDANTDFYLRLAGQALTADHTGNDFDQDHYGDSSAFALDRFGFIFKGDNATYTVGRQGAVVGATALLWNTDGKIGNYSGTIDGVNAKIKSGVTDLTILGGKVNADKDVADGNIYALHAGYSPTKALTVGATYAKVDGDFLGVDLDTSHWAVDASYALGKATVFGEYTQSDADDLNKAVAFGTNYAFDAKNSFSVTYSKVQVAGDMALQTDFDNNGKGIYYSYNHKVSKDTTVNVFYKDMKYVDGADAGEKYNSFRTTVNYKF